MKKSRGNSIVIHNGIMNHRIGDLINVETRLDYVCVLTGCGVWIPIYYYNHPQKCTTGHVDMDMELDIIRNIDKSVVLTKIDELKALGYNVIDIDYVSNIHFHPSLGPFHFTGIDYAGSSKPDYNYPAIGTNLLFGFNGEFFRAEERQAESKSRYKYFELKEVTMNIFEPHYDIVQSRFKINKILFQYGKHYHPRKRSKSWIARFFN